jgi:hypothetical protein
VQAGDLPVRGDLDDLRVREAVEHRLAAGELDRGRLGVDRVDLQEAVDRDGRGCRGGHTCIVGRSWRWSERGRAMTRVA